jgi:lipopolysaccharide transport system ATP-binding protein
MNSVVVAGISKNYRSYAHPADRLRELFGRTVTLHSDFWALADVSLTVKQGSTYGIIGENGSGKSTLLKIIAGTLQPTAGSVTLSGRVAALLELGAGFNVEFSGRENVHLNAAIMGLSAAEIERKFPEIEKFAEIGEFIDKPVKTYSSGMYVRLAFAVSIHVDPEILLVDESLSVGDVYFQQRCMRRIRQMRDEGRTILFVSHDVSAVKNLCDEALWLEHGKVKAVGEPDKVVSQYLAAMTLRKDPYAPALAAGSAVSEGSIGDVSDDGVVYSLPNMDQRWGNRQAEVLGVQLLDALGRRCETVDHGKRITLRLSVRFSEPIRSPIVGFLMRNRLGEDIAGINSSAENVLLPQAEAGHIYTVDFHIQVPLLQPGHYFFSVAVASGTHEDYVICDWVENAIKLLVSKRHTVYGYMKFDCSIELKYVGPAPAKLQEANGRS